jgi:hypothetical protein
MVLREEGAEPAGDSSVHMLAAGLKRYKSLGGPAARGEGRARTRIHARGRGQEGAGAVCTDEAGRRARLRCSGCLVLYARR